MKRKIILLFILFGCHILSLGQTICVTNESQNILIVGFSNSITVAVENFRSKYLTITTDNGTVSGGNGYYVINPLEAGKVTLRISKNVRGRSIELGRRYFRAKLLWDPIFKIGSGRDTVSRKELATQQFVRADLENSDFDIKYNVISFKTSILRFNTCRSQAIFNQGNKISDELKKELQTLQVNDVVLFTDIYVNGPYKGNKKIESVVLFVSE